MKNAFIKLLIWTLVIAPLQPVSVAEDFDTIPDLDDVIAEDAAAQEASDEAEARRKAAGLSDAPEVAESAVNESAVTESPASEDALKEFEPIATPEAAPVAEAPVATPAQVVEATPIPSPAAPVRRAFGANKPIAEDTQALEDVTVAPTASPMVAAATPAASAVPEFIEDVPVEEPAAPARTVAESEPTPIIEEEPLIEADPEPVFAPVVEEPRVAPPVVRETPRASSRRNQITNIEFKMLDGKSRIVISAREAIKYKEVPSAQIKQQSFVFDNTEIPQKLQRAYDTSEFTSPVSLFTILQMPGSNPPSTKLIVQMRDDAKADMMPDGNGLVLEYPAIAQPPQATPTEPAKIAANTSPQSTGTAQVDGTTVAASSAFSGKPISLQIKNGDVQDVLRLIAKWSGHNIVVGDDVTGKVGSLSLQNVPWDQAFALVLQSKRLGYQKDGNIIRVATLNAMKSERDEAAAAELSQIKLEALKTVVVPVSYAKAQDMLVQVKTMLSDRGSVTIDTRTNSVVIKDIQRNVIRSQKLIAALDSSPAHVGVSAKFVEMSTDFSRTLGMPQLSFNATSGTNFGISAQNSYGDSMNPITITAPNLANLSFNLSLGERDGKVKALANPSLTVVANQKGTVNQALSFVLTGTTIVGGMAVTRVQTVTANLTLDVTPIVSNDGTIFMTLDLKNEIPDMSAIPPQIQSRNINTQVLLNNGDTAVVGGIHRQDLQTQKDGIPILKDLPLLGYFFKRDFLSDKKNEIFMFLTAKILNADTVFKKAS